MAKPTNTPVLVSAKAVGAVPECSTARHAVSSRSRCCGSIILTSRVDIPKNGASNPVTSSTKPARRVTTLPGAPGSGSKNSSTSQRSLGTSDDRVAALAQHVPELVGIRGARESAPRSRRWQNAGPARSDVRRIPCRVLPASAVRINYCGSQIVAWSDSYRSETNFEHTIARVPVPRVSCFPALSRQRGDHGRTEGMLISPTSDAGPGAGVGGRTERTRALRIGKITVGALDEWSLSPGSVTSWHPTAAAQEKARKAPVSSVPISYMQRQHLRNYCERTAAGLNFSRQIIASCDVAGQCDISAMDHAVNAYLRRHDTFRSWFEQTGDGDFIRHAIDDPADIEFVPIDHGHMTVDEIRAHVVAHTESAGVGLLHVRDRPEREPLHLLRRHGSRPRGRDVDRHDDDGSQRHVFGA